MTGSGRLLVARCDSCHGRFLPREGPCPRCGARAMSPHPIGNEGIVLAATELSLPSPPWVAPHPLALVELEESVRVLAVAVAGLTPGDRVTVHRDGEVYRAEPAHSGG